MFPSRMMGGPLQPDIGPTATASVEIQLVNQGKKYEAENDL